MVGPLGPLPSELDSALQNLRTVGRTLSTAKVTTKPKDQSYGPSGSASLDFKFIFSSHLLRQLFYSVTSDKRCWTQKGTQHR